MNHLQKTWLAGPAGALAVLALGAAFAGSMPDPIATHWGVNGRPDGAMPLWVGLAIAPVLAGAGVGLAARQDVRVQRRAMAGSLGLGLALQAVLVWGNLGVDDWQQARSVPLWSVLLVLAVGGLVAWYVGRHRSSSRDAAAPGVPARAIAEGERLVWSGSAQNRVLLAADIAMAVAGVALDKPVLVVAGLLLAPFWRLRVSVGQTGAVLAVGTPTLIRRTYPLGRISRASVEQHQAPSWGYRGSRTAFGRAVWAIRRGECLALEFTDGTTLRVTVDDAETGASVLNGLLARV